METQQQTIRSLKEAAETTEKVTLELQAKDELRARQHRNLTAQLNTLKESNEEVKQFTSTPVPADISVMLNSARSRTELITNTTAVTVSEKYAIRESTP